MFYGQSLPPCEEKLQCCCEILSFVSLQKWKYNVAFFIWRLVNHDFNHSANLFMPHFWTLASFLTMVSSIKRNASPRSALASRDSKTTESSQPWNDTKVQLLFKQIFLITQWFAEWLCTTKSPGSITQLLYSFGTKAIQLTAFLI